jgi:hypothetical protein
MADHVVWNCECRCAKRVLGGQFKGRIYRAHSKSDKMYGMTENSGWLNSMQCFFGRFCISSRVGYCKIPASSVTCSRVSVDCAQINIFPAFVHTCLQNHTFSLCLLLFLIF